MSKKNILKIGIVLLIIGMIALTMQNVQATSFDANQILSTNGDGSNLNTVTPTPTAVVNNNTLNQSTNNTTNNTAKNTVKNNTVNNSTNKTALPKTGTNENIIIGLMVVFTAFGIYTFKKVRDYNM